jgi:hypothetical protein
MGPDSPARPAGSRTCAKVLYARDRFAVRRKNQLDHPRQGSGSAAVGNRGEGTDDGGRGFAGIDRTVPVANSVVTVTIGFADGVVAVTVTVTVTVTD